LGLEFRFYARYTFGKSIVGWSQTRSVFAARYATYVNLNLPPNEGRIIMADTSISRKIKVTGHVEEVRGILHLKLNWSDETCKRGRKSISTGLPAKGNKKRAEDMLTDARKAQEAILQGTPGVGGLLFADFMEQWLKHIKPDIKQTTYGGYQLNIEKTIVPYFRNRKILLQDLTADDINDFYSELLTYIKATTVHKFHANISKALKYAVEKDYIQFSIMGKVKRPKTERFVGKTLKKSETVALFEAVKGHKLELAVILGAFYGLRRGEAVGLRWEAIDFEANTLSIEHTVTYATIDGKRIIIADDTTKSKTSYRTLPLVPPIRAKLLEIQAEQERNRKLCGKSYNNAESHYIYTDALGNRIMPGYISGEFPKFLVKNGFRRIRFHDLRHSCASLLLANGVSLKEIQEWLGHSDFVITANVYAHLDFSSKIASASAMKWIDDTSLAMVSEPLMITGDISTGTGSSQSVPAFMQRLIDSGVPVDVVQEWFKQADLTSEVGLEVSFREYLAVSSG